MAIRSRTSRGSAIAAAVLLLALSSLAVGFVLLLTPFSDGFASCGSALVSATAPRDDDSWFSLCDERRSDRRGDGLPLGVLGALATAATSARLGWIARQRRPGLD